MTELNEKTLAAKIEARKHSQQRWSEIDADEVDHLAAGGWEIRYLYTTPPAAPTAIDVAIEALEKRVEWHKCSCPEPCDDYNVFPGGCTGRYGEDYSALLASLKATRETA